MGLAFVDHKQEALFWICFGCMLSTWVAVLLRVYVRTSMTKSFGWDDALIVAATVTFSVDCICIMMLAPHPAQLTFIQVGDLVLKMLVGCTAYIATSVLFKISLGIFFMRFLQESWQRWVVIAGVTVYSIFGVGFMVIIQVQCGDFSHVMQNQIEANCGPWKYLRPLNYTFAIVNMLTDWIFALMPIAMVFDANMPKRNKITASFVLGIGILCSVTSVVRLAFIEGLNVNVHLFPTPDIVISSIIELGLAMTAGSLATLRPLVNLIIDRVKKTTGNEGSRKLVAENGGNPGQGRLHKRNGSAATGTPTFSEYGFLETVNVKKYAGAVQVEEVKAEVDGQANSDPTA